jgi:hypothetical protein
MDSLPEAYYFNPTRLTNAIAKKTEFADLAQTHRIFCRRALFNHGRRHVGVAWAGCPSYTAWPGHSGDRISMGQKVARHMPSMAARSFSKNQIEKGELIDESNQRES